MFANLRRSTWTIVAAASMGLTALPAQAWGDKEQGFVAGVATTLVVDQLLTGRFSAPRHQPAPAPQPYGYASHPNNFVAPQPHQTRQPPRHHAAQSTVHQTPAAQAFRTYTLAERRQIQRSLSRAGYYGGAIDGTYGPSTHAAVTSWARNQGHGSALRATNSAYAVYDGLLF